MAAFQEVSGLAIVQEHLHRMVCHGSYFWAHQCCDNGSLQICHSLSPQKLTADNRKMVWSGNDNCYLEE